MVPYTQCLAANHRRRYRYVMLNTMQRWASAFVRDLHRAARLGRNLDFVEVSRGFDTMSHCPVRLVGAPMSCLSVYGLTSRTWMKPSFFLPTEGSVSGPTLLTREPRSTRRVVILDYDGTLTEATEKHVSSSILDPLSAQPALSTITRSPCKPTDALRGSSELCLHHQRTWATRSGPMVFRLATAGTQTELPHVTPSQGLAAEKGAFIRWPRTPPDWWDNICPSACLDLSWKLAALAVIRFGLTCDSI